MTKTIFVANQEKYVASVARTAGVNQENVKILSIDEVSTRSSRIITARFLLATSVRVRTSVLVPTGQQANIKDQSLLNRYLNENGLPNSTLTVQSSPDTVFDVVTPAPLDKGSGAGSPILGAIVGGIFGFFGLVALAFLAFRYRNKQKA